MAETKIEWAHFTFNPWIGCVAVSPACDHCYAELEAKRRGWARWGKDEPRHVTSDQYWKAPLKWNRATEQRVRVFCGSLCDVMEDRADLQSQRDRLYEVIERTPNLDWMLLTKRPQNFRRFLPNTWLANPRPNVWGMTTVESADYLWRVESLCETPFVVRGLSMEPLLSNVTLPDRFLKLRNSAWVITGGESGHHARAANPDWYRDLRQQCVSAGVAFHFKQWGEHNDVLIKIGKKAAGRTLDGRTWDEVPEPQLARI